MRLQSARDGATRTAFSDVGATSARRPSRPCMLQQLKLNSRCPILRASSTSTEFRRRRRKGSFYYSMAAVRARAYGLRHHPIARHAFLGRRSVAWRIDYSQPAILSSLQVIGKVQRAAGRRMMLRRSPRCCMLGGASTCAAARHYSLMAHHQAASLRPRPHDTGARCVASAYKYRCRLWIKCALHCQAAPPPTHRCN